MNKTLNKIIITTAVVIDVIAAILILAYTVFSIVNNSNDEETTLINTDSKLYDVYEDLTSKEAYIISLVCDDDNQKTITRNGNMARIETIKDGKESVKIVRDGNTYLIKESTGYYYTYSNNEKELKEIVNELETVLNEQSATSGADVINGKKYNYEEYVGTSYFLLSGTTALNDKEISTRFYFSGNDLVYIKTIAGDVEELISVDIDLKSDIDNSSFVIPSDLEEG